jgi:hypothetical protein
MEIFLSLLLKSGYFSDIIMNQWEVSPATKTQVGKFALWTYQ